MSKPVTNHLNVQVTIYALRCLIGFLLGYGLMTMFPKYDFFWALLSIILVIPPEDKHTLKLTTDRVISNFIGSLSGLVVFFLDIDHVIKIGLGMILAITFCRIFNLMNVARPALVALLIILVEHENSLLTPFERFLSVLIGCLIGLSITLATGYIIKNIKHNLLKT